MDHKMELDIRGHKVLIAGQYPLYLDGLRGTNWHDNRLLDLALSAKRSFVYLDIGANIGVTAIAVALLRPDATIFAFEPLAENVRYLKRNLKLNQITNCTVFETAVGNNEAAISMEQEGPWAWVSTDASASGSIPTTTIDAIAATYYANEAIDLIKIDVEGFEPKVLEGAMKTLQRCRPLIYMEFNSWTLIAHRCNPIQFAEYLFLNFDIDWASGAQPANAMAFVHDNIVQHRCIDDLVLKPRVQCAAPPDAVSTEARQLEAQLDAIKASRSWRLTAPLRRIAARARTLLKHRAGR